MDGQGLSGLSLSPEPPGPERMGGWKADAWLGGDPSFKLLSAENLACS